MIYENDLVYGYLPVLDDNFEFDFEDLEVKSEIYGAGLIEGRAGFVYYRKGRHTVDALGKPRNTSYGSDNDPIIIQLTYFVDPIKNNLYDKLSGWHQAELEFKKELKRAELLRQKEAIEAQLNELS